MPRPSFRLHHLIVAAGVFLLAVAGVLTTTVYSVRSDATLSEARSNMFDPILGEAHARLDLFFTPADTTLQLVTLHSEKPYFLQQDATTIPLSLTKTLDSARSITSIFTGYDDGQYFMIQRVNKSDSHINKIAPSQSAYILHTVTKSEDNPHIRLLRFFDSNLNIVKKIDISYNEASFDPRKRPWYHQATLDDALHVTMPYRFASSGEMGISLSRRLLNLDGVAGADINLNALVGALATLKPTPDASIALIDATGKILACSDATGITPQAEQSSLSCGPLSESTIDSLIAEEHLGPQSTRFERIVTPDGAWLAGSDRLPELGASGIAMVLAVPEDTLVAGLRTTRNDTLLLLAGGLAILLPALFFGAHLVTAPLRALAREAERGRRFDFTPGETTHSVIAEINDLALSVGHMQHTIRKFLQLAKSVSRTRDFDRLVPLLVQEMRQATASQAVLLYLPDRNHTLRLGSGCGAGGECLGHDEAVCPIPTCVTPEDRISIRTGGLSRDDASHRHIGTFLNDTDDTHWFAGVTLRDKRGAVLGELLVIDTAPFSQERLAFMRATSGVVEIALDNDRMVKTQKELFSAFIRLLAQAIDAKSPYTGGHCSRVPALSRLLAEAASNTRQGTYASFGMTEETWEELYLASWLHDCGKVTTPEFVVDKATKLETIHDRIHEIRTRFEVIKRDAHITYWKGISEGGDKAALQEALNRELRELDDDFDFVARCNTGESPVDDAARQRLRLIAERTWMRTLDDTLGVSWAERERKAPDHPLPPAMEPLLRDTSELVLQHDSGQDDQEDRWGFDMPRPEALYDRGELHNLSIPWGTLTNEERYKINEHIIQTIIMLSELPFPAHLENVPEIAGGHHERMDGTGYPRRLKGELLHPLARIMAVADIFEALTAPDRPYKKAKTLSQSMSIMVGMAKGGHIDKDLLAIFIREEVYRIYTEKHLAEWQRDTVDAEALLRDLA